MDEYLDLAQKLALQAGTIMLKYFDTDFLQREKADRSLVTVVDEEINTLFIEQVEKHYPTHSIIGEEESRAKDSDFVWVCDPLDGTMQFAKGVPVSVSSFALVHQGEPIVGVVYDPFTKRLYTASKGNGAFVNGRPMSVSNKGLGYGAVIDISWWPNAKYDVYRPIHRITSNTGTDTVLIGSTINAACRVAAGRYEAVVFSGVTNHDVASAKIIVEEAGGRVTDIFGQEQRYDQDIAGAVISNGVVHDEIVAEMDFS